MNRRTFIQAVSAALAAALVPAVAQATYDARTKPSRDRLRAFREAIAVVGQFPEIEFAAREDGLEALYRTPLEDDWQIRLILRRDEHLGDVYGVVFWTPEKSIADWRVEVEGLCETLRDWNQVVWRDVPNHGVEYEVGMYLDSIDGHRYYLASVDYDKSRVGCIRCR